MSSDREYVDGRRSYRLRNRFHRIRVLFVAAAPLGVLYAFQEGHLDGIVLALTVLAGMAHPFMAKEWHSRFLLDLEHEPWSTVHNESHRPTYYLHRGLEALMLFFSVSAVCLLVAVVLSEAFPDFEWLVLIPAYLCGLFSADWFIVFAHQRLLARSMRRIHRKLYELPMVDNKEALAQWQKEIFEDTFPILEEIHSSSQYRQSFHGPVEGTLADAKFWHPFANSLCEQQESDKRRVLRRCTPLAIEWAVAEAIQSRSGYKEVLRKPQSE